jgi:hypothetical protein
MNHRPLAVQLIAFYLWLKAIVLTGCLIAAHLHPATQSTANGIIEGLVPMVTAWREPALDIWLAPLFVLVDSTLGTGIWFLQGWARTIVVIDLTWLYSRALLGIPATIALYHMGKVHFRNPSVYFGINLVAGIVILAALCDPDLKRAFRIAGE